MFEYKEDNIYLNEYIECFERKNGGYVYSKEDINDDDLKKIYDNHRELKEKFDVLSNDATMRYLIYAFPHDSKVIECNETAEYIVIKFDVNDSFAKPLIKGKRENCFCFKFKINNWLQCNIKCAEIVGGETSNYEVDIIGVANYILSFRTIKKANESDDLITTISFNSIELLSA